MRVEGGEVAVEGIVSIVCGAQAQQGGRGRRVESGRGPGSLLSSTRWSGDQSELEARPVARTSDVIGGVVLLMVGWGEVYSAAEMEREAGNAQQKQQK